MLETKSATHTAVGTKARGFDTAGLGSDLSAALTKAIDGVTGGLANAELAGVNHVHGMYTVLIATHLSARRSRARCSWTSIRPARSR